MEKRIAYVAMLDIVGFSKLTNEFQVKKVYTLENIIRQTPTFQTTNQNSLCIKTTGDGAILCFFDDMEAPLKIAIEIQSALAKNNQKLTDEQKIDVRIGINIGQVSVRRDLAGNADIIGNAVNKAERLMSFGVTNHILASREVYDLVAVLNERYKQMFHFCGELPDKHGITHTIYNVYGDDVGNAVQPVSKTAQKEEKKAETVSPQSGATQTQKKSPYQTGGKITSLEGFVGRQEEIRQIFELIASKSTRSISVVGERRMGITSMIYYLTHQEVRQHYLRNPQEYIFTYVECPKTPNFTLEEFFLALYFSLDKTGKMTQGIAPTYDGFRKLLGYIDRMQKCVVLIIDEIDNLAKNDSFDMYFFDLLRFVDENYNIIEVVSSHLPLKAAIGHKEYPEKPFSEIFSTINLSHFSLVEAKELLLRSMKTGGPSFEPFIQLIIGLAGYHPYLLQVACSIVWDALISAPNAPLNIDAVKQKFIAEVRDVFQAYWDSFSMDERIIIADLVEGRRNARMNILIMKELARRGMIIDLEKSPKIFSEAFKDFVLKMSAQRFQSAITDFKVGFPPR
ncbi:MAG: adenylate/guanylate cyclase domain-containing protein [Ignavibacteria bacterium]|nr:adenylate/guanylate cyclase domain-containing protein [Ignavibacteria bacterium]